MNTFFAYTVRTYTEGAAPFVPMQRGTQMNEMGALWDSLCQGPKIGGMIFAAALLVALLVVRAFRMRRSRHANDEHCRRLIEKSRGKQMKRDPKGKDGAFHIDANTIPLGVRKLVKTGSPYDKGVMG